MNADEILDCKGLSCPMPILKLAKDIKSMESGKDMKRVPMRSWQKKVAADDNKQIANSYSQVAVKTDSKLNAIVEN